MTEFTKEVIEKQREQIKFISPLPWTACSCGKCGSISNETDAIAKVTMGNWGDDYPDIRRIGGSIEGKFETRENIMNAMDGELDGFLEYGEIGDSINLTIIEMEESECEKLPEFTGW